MDGHGWRTTAVVGSGTAPSVAARPIDRARHWRWLLLALFWFGLGAALLPWWLDTAPDAMRGAGSVLTAAGRIIGLVAGYVLLVQVMLMSRLGWLERWIGANDLILWHRELGGFLVVAVLAHAALVTFGYARTEHVSVLGQTWTFLTEYEEVLKAFAATAMLVGIGLLAVRGIRRALSYEVWYLLHITAYPIGPSSPSTKRCSRPLPPPRCWSGSACWRSAGSAARCPTRSGTSCTSRRIWCCCWRSATSSPTVRSWRPGRLATSGSASTWRSSSRCSGAGWSHRYGSTCATACGSPTWSPKRPT